jgi:iron complex outermembrane receptor protein
MIKQFAFLLGGIFCTAFIQAQDLSFDLQSLDVVSSRIGNDISETGKNIMIIKSEMIAEMPVNSVDELLRQIPGIELQSRGGFGVQSDLGIRGGTYNQVLVLIDGVRYNDPMTGHFNGYIPIGLAEIDRIEVIKGPSSAVYGVDAVGGVINIITRMNHSKKDLVVNAKVKAGSYNYGGLDAGFYGNFSSWLVSASAFVNSSEGQKLPNPNYGIVASAPENYQTYFNLGTYSVAFGKELKKGWKAYVRAAYDDRDFNAKYFYTASNYDESTEQTRIFFSQLKVTKQSENSKTDIDVSYRWGDDLFIFNPEFPSNANETDYLLAQFNQYNSLNDKWALAYGLQLDRRAVQSIDRGDHDDLHGGLYAQLKYNPISGLNTNLSMRMDFDDNYGSELTPQLNASYFIHKWNIRGGLGRSIRAADYTERYVSTNLPYLSSSRNLGNPDLQAEQSWNFELGADYYIQPDFKISLTPFYRIGNNLIDYIATPASEISTTVELDSNGVYFYAQNLSKVNTFGVEAELWYQWILDERSNLAITFGYTYLSSKNPDGDISKYVSSHAKNFFNSNVIYNYKMVNVGFSALFKERKTAYSDAIGMTLEPTYFVLNGIAGVNVLKKRLHIDLEVMNIFNENYQDILGAIMPGRWFIASLAYTL